MNTRDMDALYRWQASTPGQTEYTLYQLQTTIDDLTSLFQTREGAREIKFQRDVIKESLRKLHDLYLDTQPALAAE